MAEGYVLGIGAANMDVHGKSRVPIVMRDSNPGHLRTSAGGVTRNVLENLSRLGVRTKLVSAVGADLYGEMVLRSSAAAGIDISGVVTIPGAASSCYISVLDQKGDMLVAMSDMGILENITPELVRSLGGELRGAAAVVCDPCLPSRRRPSPQSSARPGKFRCSWTRSARATPGRCASSRAGSTA